jgi:hypothetical protein
MADTAAVDGAGASSPCGLDVFHAEPFPWTRDSFRCLSHPRTGAFSAGDQPGAVLCALTSPE